MIKFIKSNWLLVLSLIYIISPIDFIPEFLIGPLGLVDDLGLIIIMLLFAVINSFKAKKGAKHISKND